MGANPLAPFVNSLAVFPQYKRSGRMAFLQRTSALVRQGVLSRLAVQASPALNSVRAFASASYLDKNEVTHRVLSIVKNFDRVDAGKVRWRMGLVLGDGALQRRAAQSSVCRVQAAADRRPGRTALGRGLQAGRVPLARHAHWACAIRQQLPGLAWPG